MTSAQQLAFVGYEEIDMSCIRRLWHCMALTAMSDRKYFRKDAIMKIFAVGVLASSAIAATIALPDDTDLINQMTMKPLAPQESAQLRAERDTTANATWQKLTPEQRMAIKDTAKTKKQGDLNAIEPFGQDDDMRAASKTETADLKAERAAAKAKWDAMTPDEKAAVRKVIEQKRASELSAIEKAAQESDMNRYFTY